MKFRRALLYFSDYVGGQQQTDWDSSVVVQLRSCPLPGGGDSCPALGIHAPVSKPTWTGPSRLGAFSPLD